MQVKLKSGVGLERAHKKQAIANLYKATEKLPKISRAQAHRRRLSTLVHHQGFNAHKKQAINIIDEKLGNIDLQNLSKAQRKIAIEQLHKRVKKIK